ncbi:MAG: AAA family ATPase [Pseudomonadota bacterium]|nr:AAA family ATPase [Pseudomonadota bacterium]
MNDLAVIRPQTDQFHSLQQWVELGLAAYIESLTQESLAQESLAQVDAFEQQRIVFEQQWHALEGRTGKLIRQLNLSQTDVFLLFLTGMMETQPKVAFAITELQQPSDQARLSIHLMLDILQTLFPATQQWDALDLIHRPLFDESVISLSGDGPLSLRSLSISIPLWSVLKNNRNQWQGTSQLIDSHRALLPDETRKRLTSLCQHLTTHPFMVIRGQNNSGQSILASELGLLAGLDPINIPYELWQEQPQLRLASAIADWLPVITLPDLPGESYEPKAPVGDSSAVLISGVQTSVVIRVGYHYTLPMPDPQQRSELWQEHVKDKSLSEKLAGSALLSGPMIQRIGRQSKSSEDMPDMHQERHIRMLRAQNIDPGLSQLAQVVTRDIPKSAVVFPKLINEHLDDLIARALQRESLYLKLGQTLSANQNPGLRALFVGDSGTGKTLAASYVATQIGAPLYRVDLGSVINKYIGESEKNLGRLLDYAAATDTVLLFDEAESVFGHRTDARSSNERFANNLTNYLLARIENHPGIVLLTTNHRDRIDPAFNRRLEIIIDFPQPGFNERLTLWKNHMGQRSPTEDFLKALASHCELSGGQIRNAVLCAAANSSDDAVLSERAIVRAVAREYQKLGRSLPAALQNQGMM